VRSAQAAGYYHLRSLYSNSVNSLFMRLAAGVTHNECDRRVIEKSECQRRLPAVDDPSIKGGWPHLRQGLRRARRRAGRDVGYDPPAANFFFSSSNQLMTTTMLAEDEAGSFTIRNR
jgi:hypothetical protein